MARCLWCPSQEFDHHLTCRAPDDREGKKCREGWMVCVRCGSVIDRKGHSVPSERLLAMRRETE
jgi:hypothetical protein